MAFASAQLVGSVLEPEKHTSAPAEEPEPGETVFFLEYFDSAGGNFVDEPCLAKVAFG